MSIIAFLTTILVIIVNVLANILPINGYNTGEVSDMYPNLFVPAGITFSIWILIFLMLFFFSLVYIYLQFKLKKKHHKLLLLVISSNFLNISWILAWHYLLILPSVIIMILLLINLILLYFESKKYNYNIGYKIFIKGTISIYLSWISIATIANIATYLVSINWNRWGISEIIWTIIVLLFALLISLTFTYYERNFLYNVVVIWAYAGIILKRVQTDFSSTYPIVITASVSILIIIFYTYKRLRKKVNLY